MLGGNHLRTVLKCLISGKKDDASGFLGITFKHKNKKTTLEFGYYIQCPVGWLSFFQSLSLVAIEIVSNALKIQNFESGRKNPCDFKFRAKAIPVSRAS